MSFYRSFNIRSFVRRFWLIILLALLLFGIAVPINAAVVRGDENVTVGKNEVIDDDLIVAGNTIMVNGVVNGDLVAAGSQIIVNGHVKGSLIFAGQSLYLNGTVDGAVYGGGATLTVGPEARVGRNLFFGGYSYRSEAGALIGRDALIGGYQAIINGEVSRNLYASLAALVLNGKVGGNVTVMVDQPGDAAQPSPFTGFGSQPMPPAVQPGLHVGPEAKIGGKFTYTSPVEQAAMIQATPGGGIIYNTAPANGRSNALPTQSSKILEWLLTQARRFVSLILLGALAIWLAPSIFKAANERMTAKPIEAAGWGLLVTIVGYSGAILATIAILFIVAGLATMTLAGLALSAFGLGFSALGLAGMIFSMVVVYGSKLIVFYPLTQSWLARSMPSWNKYWIVPLSLGAFIFVLLSSIPWLGTLFSIVVTLVGLGAIWMAIRDRYTKSRTVAPQFALTPA